tara:strand:- start:1823 stop:2074 length:252 start_codon:yes stop_codon:yes gene_type:complete
MASPRAANPGRTARYYRSNPKARAKHNRDNNTGGKHDKPKEYTRKHSEVRRAKNIMGKGGGDVVKKKNGSWGTQSMKINRSRK